MSRRRKPALIMTVLFIILFLSFLNTLQDNLYNNSNLLPDENSVSLLRENFKGYTPISHPSFAIQSFQIPKILFIVADPASLDPTFDQPFYDFMNLTLNYSVMCHDDNDSYSYENYDAIVISDSIAVDQVSSLENATIPILIMESFTYNVFHLASGRGRSFNTDSIYIINSNHNITLEETNDTLITIYNSTTAELTFLKGYGNLPLGAEIVTLAQRVWNNVNEGTLVTLDKGKKSWNTNISASERRAFWGVTQGNVLNQHGWDLWNRTLRWILYDYQLGYATININVKDKANWNIPNARVNLTHSDDINQYFSQNTTTEGQITFSSIPYGYYNLTVEFEDSINDTFSSLEIAGERTYQSTAQFEFTINMNEWVDNDPPNITSIGFLTSNKTFYATITDTLPLTTVNLSLTASNVSHTITGNYTMVTKDGMIYFNDTEAQKLTTPVNIAYNITAIDIAGNIRISDTYRFLLGDIVAPIIFEYNHTDYKNGTIEFYANVTDDQSDVQDPVILKINESLVEMHLNTSGYWIYRTQAFYGKTLNYTIWSVNDSVGNQNGTKINLLKPVSGLVSPKDFIEPHIWNVEGTFDSHENGLVKFSASIDDWTEYQSGVNTSSIRLILSVNGVKKSYIMNAIGKFTYYFEFQFEFEDVVNYYLINASDLAGNVYAAVQPGPFLIDDNAIPIVTFGAYEYGNGTVDFYADVIDWPYNETTTILSYTQNWGDLHWPNITMTQISESYYCTRVLNDRFQLQNIWFYVTAVDSSGNSYEPKLEEAKNIPVTDKVPPTVTLTIENSETKDGEIIVMAYTTDKFSYSNFVNNTHYITLSSESTYINTTMNYNPTYRYWVKKYGFPDRSLVNITIRVQDDAGNWGNITEMIRINDNAPPKISKPESIVFQNGSVTIWVEVTEGIYGSGLPEDNSSVTIEYFKESFQINATMRWNGSGNYYAYSISGFEPKNTLMYRIIAVDKNNNHNKSEWMQVPIIDLTPPIYHAFNYNEKPINHTSSELNFWVEADDLFGKIAGVNITLNYFDTSRWLNWTSKMHYNGSHYVYTTQLICNNSLRYYLTIYDEALNVNETSVLSYKTMNFQTVTAKAYGLEYNVVELHPGQVRFWIQILDPFEDHNLTSHPILLSVTDETFGTEILNEEIMIYNGTHFIYTVSTIPYLSNFSYLIQVIDDGVLEGYYDPIRYSNTTQMRDYWRPIIVSSEIQELNETAYIVWVNVSDWGSGITEVRLYYEFESASGGNGANINQKWELMEFNGSYYIRELPFSETGTLNWYIEAYDSEGKTTSQQYQTTIFIEEAALPGLTLPQILMVILGTLIVLISVIFSGITIQRKLQEKSQQTAFIQSKLSQLSNIYTILVSTEVGIPIYSVTNILYKKDDTLDDTLSGLSVGIDSFLNSFQSDFVNQFQAPSLELDTGGVRISVIEQHKIQILIAASLSYRIFVFLKEKPPEFLRSAFTKVIKDIETNILIADLGFVDGTLIKPQIKAIMMKHIPLTLLSPFTIDTSKLRSFDEKLRSGVTTVPISRSGINALKRLVISRTEVRSNGRDPPAEIKLFDELVKRNELKSAGRLIFYEAEQIMTKILKIPPKQIYEALWVGSSPKVKIIVPTP